MVANWLSMLLLNAGLAQAQPHNAHPPTKTNDQPAANSCLPDLQLRLLQANIDQQDPRLSGGSLIVIAKAARRLMHLSSGQLSFSGPEDPRSERE